MIQCFCWASSRGPVLRNLEAIHDVDEFLQVLALLHERHANVLDGGFQLQKVLGILCKERVKHCGSGTMGRETPHSSTISTNTNINYTLAPVLVEASHQATSILANP